MSLFKNYVDEFEEIVNIQHEIDQKNKIISEEYQKALEIYERATKEYKKKFEESQQKLEIYKDKVNILENKKQKCGLEIYDMVNVPDKGAVVKYKHYDFCFQKSTRHVITQKALKIIVNSETFDQIMSDDLIKKKEDKFLIRPTRPTRITR